MRTKAVSVETARGLGFWHDDTPDDNPPQIAEGLVEVPAWRHAAINYPHPLLTRGLVVLDTPGLNAIGAEPELTLSLLPAAHAVVFILGADTGVTKSDMAVWRDHLGGQSMTRFVVLNKIDALVDPLLSEEAVREQIEQQCRSTAATLDVGRERVFPLSARQALAGRIDGDRERAGRQPPAGSRGCLGHPAAAASPRGHRAHGGRDRAGRRAGGCAPPDRPASAGRRTDARVARPARQEQWQGAADDRARRPRDARVRALHRAPGGPACGACQDAA